MAGMMISMSLGMIGGLTVGVILGILFSGDLFTSTILAMLFGLITGFLAGLPIGFMPVIDGTMTGIMGGMMGAMIALENQETIIRVMLLLYIGMVVILYRMMQHEFIKSKAVVNHPVIMIVLFVLFSIWYNQMGPLLPSQHSSSNSNHHSMESNNLFIQAEKYLYSLDHTEIIAGNAIIFTSSDIGKERREIENFRKRRRNSETVFIIP